jgi:DNA-binding NarL/FixJ family response regulator
MKTLRILVADDHDIVRQGVRTLLEARPEWEVCGEAVDGREAVGKAIKLKPDIAILDISMPGLNGLEATRQILRAVPQTEVMIVTMHESEQLVRDVLHAGARGYVVKSDARRDLVAAVEALSQHKAFLSPGVAGTVLKDYLEADTRAGDHRPSHSYLTPREREIVQLLAEGKSNKEVAARLGISVKTAETHRSNIMRKLSLHTISDVVRYAIRNKVIEA